MQRCIAGFGSKSQIGPTAGGTSGIARARLGPCLGLHSRLTQASGFVAGAGIEFLDQRADLRLRSAECVAEIRRPGPRSRIVEFADDAAQLTRQRLQGAAAMTCDRCEHAGGDSMAGAAQLARSLLVA